MPRNGSGSYSLPEAAFVPNTPISSAAVNSDFSDIASAITGSLARDGQGGMTAVLPLANLGFVYLNDPNTGMRRTAADEQAIQCGSADVATFTTTGISITGSLAVSGAFTVGGAPLLPVGLGPLPWSGLTAPAKWLFCFGQSLLRASYPDLWNFAQTEIAGGNTLYTNGDGTTTFTIPDMRGRVPAGKDNMGGVAATRLTNTTMTPDGNTLGAANNASNGQTVTLTLGQLPTGITSSGTATGINDGAGRRLPVASASESDLSFSPSGSGVHVPAATSWLFSNSLSGSASVTSNNTSGSAHGNVQPTIITNYILYAGV